MAQLRLGRYEVEPEQLPPVCACCGEPATAYKSKTFSWTPPWAYPPIVAVFLTKRMRASLPFCARHKSHWLMRTLVALLGLLGILGFGALGVAVGVMLGLDAGPDSGGSAIVGVVVMLCLFLLVAWLVVLLVLHFTSIRSTEVTDDTLTLTGLHEGFVRAVYEQDEEGEEDRRSPARDQEARQKWSPRGKPTRRGGDDEIRRY
jgi:hypothetical protein